jgi:hypothetical protein
MDISKIATAYGLGRLIGFAGHSQVLQDADRAAKSAYVLKAFSVNPGKRITDSIHHFAEYPALVN